MRVMKLEITARFIFAVISTTIEETAILLIGLLLLPRSGIQIPLFVLIAVMIFWAAYSVFTFRLGTRALESRLPLGLPHMVGCSGTVETVLAPEGLVRIRAELWVAKSTTGEIEPGTEIIVISQERLKLVVRVDDSGKPC